MVKFMTMIRLQSQKYGSNSMLKKVSTYAHGCNFTAVYFLDLPEGTPNTIMGRSKQTIV